jgi:hypothetical protein
MIIRPFLMILLTGFLAGCGLTSSEEKPVGIGAGRDDFKPSPCQQTSTTHRGLDQFVKCFVVPQAPADDDWLRRMKGWAAGDV